MGIGLNNGGPDKLRKFHGRNEFRVVLQPSSVFFVSHRLANEMDCIREKNIGYFLQAISYFRCKAWLEALELMNG